MSITKISVTYDRPQGRSNFCGGDTLTGKVLLELSKDTSLQGLTVRVQGKASVFWTEHNIVAISTYKAKELLFSSSTDLLEHSRPESKVLPAGCHVFPFSFNIPDIELPDFWTGRHGSVSYSLEARAKRFMRLDRKDRDYFFVDSPNNFPNLDIMKPQQQQDEKKGVFSSGKMSISVAIEKMAYVPGEGLKVTTQIANNSKDSKATPKYTFYEKQSFFVKSKRKVHTKNIVEEKGELVPAGEQQTQTTVLQIPTTLHATMLNCNIIKREYRLKVHLEGPLNYPEVKLPIVLLSRPKQKPQEELH